MDKISSLAGAGRTFYSSIRVSSPSEIVKKASSFAVPFIYLTAASMINTAEAISFNECIDNCNEDQQRPHLVKLMCYALCAIFARG